jgi:hypothetical protein
MRVIRFDLLDKAGFLIAVQLLRNQIANGRDGARGSP